MKIKNSNEKLRLGIMCPVMFGGTLVIIVLRCLQLVKFIDSETGFVVGGEWLNILLCGLIAALCIFFWLVGYLSAESKKIELVAIEHRFAAVASVLFTVSLFYDCGDSLVDSLLAFDGMTVSGDNFAALIKAMMASGVLPYAMQSLFALLSAFYGIILARSFFKGSSLAHKHKFIALAPIAWAGFKLITRFVKQISYIKVSDLFLELIMIAFMVMFFVALSQVCSGVYSDDSRWRITTLGFSGAMLSFCINVPRLIFTVLGGTYINKEYPFSLDDAMFGVLALAVALAAMDSLKGAIASERKN